MPFSIQDLFLERPSKDIDVVVVGSGIRMAEALAEKLKGEGYPVARRTVAKYREQLGIPVARLRR